MPYCARSPLATIASCLLAALYRSLICVATRGLDWGKVVTTRY